MRRVSLIRIAGLVGVVTTAASCEQLLGLDRFHNAICSPGEQKSSDDCPYSGPAGTRGVGICRAGVRICADDGLSWGACTDPILPMADEDCSTPEDDNCDGQSNEASAGCCEPGTATACYSGPVGTEGVGVCMAGTQPCGKSGRPEGTCTAEIKPQQETCSAPEDEDCDGHDCVEWAKLLGDDATQSFTDVATDAAGASIAVGGLYGAVSLGETTLTESGSGDILVVKVDVAGKPIWGRIFGDAGKQQGGSIAVDSTGNVVFSGCTQTTLDLAGVQIPPGDFVAKLSADGQTLSWAKGLATGAAACANPAVMGVGQPGNITKVVATPTNDIVIVGAFDSSIDFGAGPLSPSGGSDGFVAKLGSANGTTAWFKTFGDSEKQQANDVTVIPTTGEILVVGDFQGTISFGGASVTATSQGGRDAFVLRLAQNGFPEHLNTFGDAAEQSARTICLATTSGGYLVSGPFSGLIDLGGGLTSSGSGDAYIIAFDASDSFKWSKRFGGNDFFGSPLDASTDAQGNLVIFGAYSGSIDFGSGPLYAVGTNVDLFLAKLSTTGQQIWAKSFDGGPFLLGRMRVHKTGEEVVAGGALSSVDFGTGILMPAGADAFMAKFGP